MKTQKPKTKLTPVARSIRSREYAIARMKAKKNKIMQWAADDCAKLDRQIAERQLILDALRAGSLK